MSARIEAIYEGGVFKPVSPPKDGAEESEVWITIEPAISIELFWRFAKDCPGDCCRNNR